MENRGKKCELDKKDCEEKEECEEEEVELGEKRKCEEEMDLETEECG